METISGHKCLEENNEMNDKNDCKDSFHRFGDNLCEVLLTSLPINDKFRFECVSKQWKRLIFKKQEKLILEPCVKSRGNRIKGPTNEDNYDLIHDFYVEIDRNIIRTPKNSDNYNLIIEKILKKLNLLKDFECRLNFGDYIFRSIIDNCLTLERISLQGFVTQELLLEFCQKFGNSIISFALNTFNMSLDEIFAFTKNIKKLILFTNLNQSKVFLPQLEDIYFCGYEHIEDLSRFASLYCKQIKKIQILFCVYDYPNDKINRSLIEISKFEILETLSLNINLNNNTPLLIDSELKKIGNECKFLKSLKIKANFKLTNENFFRVLNRFKALIKLDLDLENSDQSYGEIKDMRNGKLLKFIRFGRKTLSDQTLTDNTFENIHRYLPNLKCFIQKKYQFSKGLTDKTLISLSKLQKLETIEISSAKITDSGVCHLIDFCPNIKNITIDSFNVTEVSLKAMTKLVEKNPKIEYQFSNGGTRVGISRFQSGNRSPDASYSGMESNSPNSKPYYFDII